VAPFGGQNGRSCTAARSAPRRCAAAAGQPRGDPSRARAFCASHRRHGLPHRGLGAHSCARLRRSDHGQRPWHRTSRRSPRGRRARRPEAASRRPHPRRPARGAPRAEYADAGTRPAMAASARAVSGIPAWAVLLQCAPLGPSCVLNHPFRGRPTRRMYRRARRCAASAKAFTRSLPPCRSLLQVPAICFLSDHYHVPAAPRSAQCGCGRPGIG
jgi:hypothetical protein